MKDKKFNDKLEEIFSERLNEENPKASSWNTPGDELWHRIAQDIPPQKRRRRLLWLLFIFFFLLCSIFLATCNFFNIQNDENPVEKVLIPTTEEKPNDILSAQSSESAQAAADVRNRAVASTQDGQFQSASTSSFPLPEINPQTLSLAFTKKEEQAQANNQAATTDSLLQKTTENTTTPTPNDQATLSLEALTSKASSLLPTSNQITIETPAFDKNPKNWALETLVGYAFGLRNYVVNTNTAHLLLNDTRTLSTALHLEKNITKNWSAGLGVQYSKLNFDADYEVHLNYSGVGEQEQTDGFTNAYQENLPSLAGSLNTQLLLFRATGDQVAEGEDVPVAVHLNHSIEYLSVPVFVKFRQTEKRLGWYARAALIPGTVIGALETQHLATQSQHERLHHQSSSFILAKETAIEQNPVTLHFSGSLGLNFKLTPQQHLFVEPGIWGELIPTYPNAALTKKALHLNLSIGFRQRL